MVGTLRGELDAKLRERYDAVPLDELDAAAAARAAVAVTSGVWGVRAEHLDRMPGLGAVVNFGVGYDATDVAEAARRGVVVSNTPDVLTDCVADTAIGLLIDVMRRLSAADRFVRRGEWAEGRVPALARRVTGARVGILGLGRIGLAIAHRLAAFDATISYHNRRERTDVDYAYAASPLALAPVVRRARRRGRRWCGIAAPGHRRGPRRPRAGRLPGQRRPRLGRRRAGPGRRAGGAPDRRRGSRRLRRRAAASRRRCSAATTSCCCPTSAAPRSRRGTRWSS